VVSIRGVSSLQALQRSLLHYGKQSWLVFESMRVQEKRIWLARLERLTVVGQRVRLP
jgi:hypothetical protein